MIGLLLAGGQARRLGGGDKGSNAVGGGTIVERIVARMRPQCDTLVLNANGDPLRFAALGLPVLPDALPNQAGPLAGILAGLDHVASRQPREHWMVTVPTDTPFLPGDLVARLLDAPTREQAVVVHARSGGRPHYLAALWAVGLRHDLRRVLCEEGQGKVSGFIARHAAATVEWPVDPLDPFFNVNTPDDLEQARRIAVERERRV